MVIPSKFHNADSIRKDAGLSGLSGGKQISTIPHAVSDTIPDRERQTDRHFATAMRHLCTASRR